MEPKTARACIGQEEIFRTLSRDRETTSGMFEGTEVLTAKGARAVETLGIGDRIVTRRGIHVLKSIEIIVETVTPYRISPDTLGHGRPEDAMLLPGGQKVYIRDWRAKAIFGKDQVMARVARLADGEYIARQEPRKMRLYRLIFDRPQIFYAGGLELASEEEIRVPIC